MNPNVFTSVKRGTMSICGGIITPASTTQNRTLRPRKGTREKAKAARLASSTTTTVMITDVSALLKYHLRMFPASSTCLNASREKLDENQLTGIAMVSLSGLSAVSTAQAS